MNGVVLEKISLRPNRICFYKEYNGFNKSSKQYLNSVNDYIADNVNDSDKNINSKSLDNLKNNKHEFKLSKSAQKSIKEKIHWLYELSKEKTIKTLNNKKLRNIKITFITLTLPSVQDHDTAIIIKECLNQLITELRKNYELNNYLWKCEYQRNGNVHFHLVCDVYIDYFIVNTKWNRIINKLGYIGEYSNKFSAMSCKEYIDYSLENIDMYKNDNKTSYKEKIKRIVNSYNSSKSKNWKQPNTTDVKIVYSAKAIGSYIAKYISKNENEKVNEKVKNRDGKDSNLRLWYCSRSLSKLTSIKLYIEENNDDLDFLLGELNVKNEFILEYVTLWFYDTQAQSKEFKEISRAYFGNYAKSLGYSAN